jgi:acyl CoA:acetate/3-ketoacid CoA transferase alpha subunit
VNNHVGFVDRNPGKIIADAIEEKAKELAVYQANAGPDIRLLLVADRICGKLMLESQAASDLKGFQVVYFSSYPESVMILDHAVQS